MKTRWHIREATLEDADGLAACMESAYTVYQGRMGGQRLPPMDVNYLAEIENYPTWVVDDQGRVAGGLILSFELGQALIANIAVERRSQGRGMGAALMRFAEAKAREKGFSELHLTTHVLLHENLSLYRHLGWQETARDETRVFMMKKI